jgi:hypothetical protein
MEWGHLCTVEYYGHIEDISKKIKIQSRPYTQSSCCEAFTKGKKIKN